MRLASLRFVLVALAAAPMPLLAQWQVGNTPASSGRHAAVTAMLRERADSAVADEDAISLVIRCSGNQLEGFLTTRDQLDSDLNSDVRVRAQADSLRGRDMRWAATKAGTGAFIPTNDLRDLIQHGIVRSQQLRITVPTLRRGRVTYVFDVAGFLPALDALRNACPNDRGGALASPVR